MTRVPERPLTAEAYWQAELDRFPEPATIYGFAGPRNGKLTDLSPAGFTRWEQQLQGFRARRQASTPRRFHDVVLDDGAVTLPILAHNVRRWIATERRTPNESRSTGFVQAAATILTL